MGNNFTGTGRLLVIAGIFLVVLGLLFLLGERIPGLGRLPGDIVIKREKFVFYFPLGTCLLLSLLLSLYWQFSPGGEKVNLYRTDGIVLRTRPLGEADKVLTLLSRDRGKIEVVARGARRPRNRLAAAAQPFSYLKILVFTGRSLDQLSQAEIVKAFGLIRENLVRMAYASFWSEFLDLLLPLEEENTGLFSLLWPG